MTLSSSAASVATKGAIHALVFLDDTHVLASMDRGGAPANGASEPWLAFLPDLRIAVHTPVAHSIQAGEAVRSVWSGKPIDRIPMGLKGSY